MHTYYLNNEHFYMQRTIPCSLDYTGSFSAVLDLQGRVITLAGTSRFSSPSLVGLNAYRQCDNKITCKYITRQGRWPCVTNDNAGRIFFICQEVIPSIDFAGLQAKLLFKSYDRRLKVDHSLGEIFPGPAKLLFNSYNKPFIIAKLNAYSLITYEQDCDGHWLIKNIECPCINIISFDAAYDSNNKLHVLLSCRKSTKNLYGICEAGSFRWVDLSSIVQSCAAPAIAVMPSDHIAIGMIDYATKHLLLYDVAGERQSLIYREYLGDIKDAHPHALAMANNENVLSVVYPQYESLCFKCCVLTVDKHKCINEFNLGSFGYNEYGIAEEVYGFGLRARIAGFREDKPVIILTSWHEGILKMYTYEPIV